MPAVRALPWGRILAVARIVLDRFADDIPKRDRTRLTALLRKSKGDPRRLTGRERQELLRIVKGVQVGQLRDDIVEQVAPFGTKRLLRRR